MVGTQEKNLQEDLEKIIAGIPRGVPIAMLNLLQFKEYASYGHDDEAAKERLSGEKAYFQNYLEQAKDHVAAVGGEFIHQGRAVANFNAAEGELWHATVLVTYPSIDAFLAMVSSSDYAKLEPHREAALADSRVIATVNNKSDFA